MTKQTTIVVIGSLRVNSFIPFVISEATLIQTRIEVGKATYPKQGTNRDYI